MGMFNKLRYEAQTTPTGRASCKICGNLIDKGTYILKILGVGTNESLHPTCVADLTLGLRDVITQTKDEKKYVVRASDGIVKLGYYADTDNPKKKRFTTLKIVKLASQSEKKGETK